MSLVLNHDSSFTFVLGVDLEHRFGPDDLPRGIRTKAPSQTLLAFRALLCPRLTFLSIWLLAMIPSPP